MNCECPQCGSKAFKRNGYTRHGKQNHRCLDCGRQFSLEPLYAESTTHPIDFMSKILSEGTIELEGIC
jgi:transposase-like protein